MRRSAWFLMAAISLLGRSARCGRLTPYQPTDPFDPGPPEFPLPIQPTSERGEMVLTCESIDDAYQTCYPGVAIKRVRLERKLSDADCRSDLNWGYQNDFIWVDNGCRAKFRVYFSELAKVTSLK